MACPCCNDIVCCTNIEYSGSSPSATILTYNPQVTEMYLGQSFEAKFASVNSLTCNPTTNAKELFLFGAAPINNGCGTCAGYTGGGQSVGPIHFRGNVYGGQLVLTSTCPTNCPSSIFPFLNNVTLSNQHKCVYSRDDSTDPNIGGSFSSWIAPPATDLCDGSLSYQWKVQFNHLSTSCIMRITFWRALTTDLVACDTGQRFPWGGPGATGYLMEYFNVFDGTGKSQLLLTQDEHFTVLSCPGCDTDGADLTYCTFGSNCMLDSGAGTDSVLMRNSLSNTAIGGSLVNWATPPGLGCAFPPYMLLHRKIKWIY